MTTIPPIFGSLTDIVNIRVRMMENHDGSGNDFVCYCGDAFDDWRVTPMKRWTVARISLQYRRIRMENALELNWSQ